MPETTSQGTTDMKQSTGYGPKFTPSLSAQIQQQPVGALPDKNPFIFTNENLKASIQQKMTKSFYNSGRSFQDKSLLRKCREKLKS